MELFYSRWKLGIGLGLVIFLFLFVASDILRNGPDGRDWFFVSIFAWICGWLVVRVGGRILNPEPGLVVNEEGIRFAGVFEDPVVFGWGEIRAVRIEPKEISIFLESFSAKRVRAVGESYDFNRWFLRRHKHQKSLLEYFLNYVPHVDGVTFGFRGAWLLFLTFGSCLIAVGLFIPDGPYIPIVIFLMPIVFTLTRPDIHFGVVFGSFGVMNPRWDGRDALILKDEIANVDIEDSRAVVTTHTGRRAKVQFKGLGRPWSFQRVDMSVEIEEWRKQIGI